MNNIIIDYTFLAGIALFIVGLFCLLYICLKMIYTAIKEKEPIFVCVGFLSSGFLITLLSLIFDALVKSIH